MPVSLGDAVIEVTASMDGFEKSVESGVDDAMAGVEQKTGDTGKKSGSKMGAFLGGALKKTALAVGGGAVATLGYGLVKGFQRLTAIDDAKAKLLGLGNSAGDVQKIMDNALAAVKGTAYGLGEAATTAAAAVAAGVKPGQDLTKYLTLVGDAASIAGVGMDEMGAIFNKVTTAGMAQTDDLNQIADRGIPIWTALGEMYGKTAVEVRKMASEGKISAADFNQAMQSMVGGAAQEAGKTFTGAFANLKAALGRVGANFLEPFFAAAIPAMGALTGLLEPAEAAATHLGNALKGVFDVLAANSDILPGIAVGVGLITVAFNANTIALKAQVLWYQAWTVATKVATVASNIFALGLRGIGKAMYAALGPVGWVMAAIGVLVTIFTVAYQRSETFRNFVNKALNGVKTVAKTVVDWFKSDFLNFFTETLPNAFRFVVDWVKNNWPKIVALITGPIGTAILILTGHGDQIKELFTGIFDGAREALGGLGDWVGGVWQKIADRVPILETARSRVVDAFGGLAGPAKEAAASVADAVGSMINWFVAFGDMSVSEIVSEIGSQLANLGNILYTRGKEAFARIKDGAADSVAGLINWVMALPGRIHTAAAGLATVLTERGGALIQSIIDGASAKVGELIGWVTGLPARIKAKVTGWATYLATHGGELIQGIIDGAKAKALELRDWIVGLPQRLKEWLPNAGEWLKTHGQQILQGLVKGLKIAIPVLLAVVVAIPALIAGAIIGAAALLVYAGVTLVVELAKGIGKAIASKLQPVFTKLTNWMKGKFASAWSTVTNVIIKPVQEAGARIGNAWGKIQQAFAKARDWVRGGWRNSWSNVQDWMSNAVGKGRVAISKTWDGIRNRFTKARDWTRSNWRNSWSNVADWISDGVQKGRQRTSKIWDGIRDRFTAARKWTGSTWRNRWSKIKDWIADPVGSARNMLNRHRESIRRGLNALDNFGRHVFGGRWAKMKEILSKPVRGALDWFRGVLGSGGSFRNVLNGFVDAATKIMNGLKRAFGAPVQWVVNNAIIPLANAAAKVGEKVGVKITPPKPMILSYDTGGIVPGYSPGVDDHIIGASGGEAVMRPEFTRAVGPDFVHSANAAARAGGVAGAKKFLAEANYGRYAGGFANGGVVQPVPGRGNRHTSGYSWATWAGDFPIPMNTPVKAWKDGIVAAVQHLTTSYGKHIRLNHDDGSSSLYAHLNKTLVSVGDKISAGATIGLSDSTGNSTGPHLHFETMGKPYNGGSGSGAQADAQAMGFLSKIKDLMTVKLPEKFGDNTWTQLLTAIPKKLGEAAIDKLKGLVANIGDGVMSGISWAGNKLAGLSKEQADNAAKIIDVAHQLGFGDRGAIIGLITALVESGLRNVNYGDRDSLGLFQQRAPWGSAADRMNPSKSASMFFNGGQGGQPGLRDKNWRTGSLGALAQAVQVSAFPGRYALQVPRAQLILQAFKAGSKKYDNGGWVPPGYSVMENRTGSREPAAVFTQDQWQILHDLASRRTTTGTTLKPGDRVVFEIEGKPMTAIAKQVLGEETRRALVRN